MYADIAHANEEVISDHVRHAYWVIVAGWGALIIALFILEFGKDAPDAATFLMHAVGATFAVAVLYGALVGIRRFAHQRPHQWHVINWSVLWLTLLSMTVYFYATEGRSENSIVSAVLLVVVFTYRWLMHNATISWHLTRTGVTEQIGFLGYTQTHRTAWKEVSRHRVHPLTGAVELSLKGHYWHWKPRVHLIVPNKAQRKKVHHVLKKVLWPTRSRA